MAQWLASAVLVQDDSPAFYVYDQEFAHGGARKEAAALGVPLLGEIALDPLVRERSDAGLPIVVTEPESAATRTYRQIARAVWERLGERLPPASA